MNKIIIQWIHVTSLCVYNVLNVLIVEHGTLLCVYTLRTHAPFKQQPPSSDHVITWNM